MPKGHYERRPRNGVTLASSDYAAPMDAATTIMSVSDIMREEATVHRTAATVWRSFDACQALLAGLSGTERRAVIGALQGWFNDGKYE
jgi:hypothetical protein